MTQEEIKHCREYNVAKLNNELAMEAITEEKHNMEIKKLDEWLAIEQRLASNKERRCEKGQDVI